MLILAVKSPCQADFQIVGNGVGDPGVYVGRELGNFVGSSVG